jgi:hypothetical protein
MKNTIDPLEHLPNLRYLRDALLIRDPTAKICGEGFLTRVMLLTAMHSKLPPDRLLNTEDAACLIGVDKHDFDHLAYQAQIKPHYVLTNNSYWLVRDVYRLVES